ncbi:triacylglycerol lipase [Catellatospora sp. NPDC049133]|uniref:esterase/lipase family protein n=1 Tax=Catellatospora sp. NPDC049133 TaxID=3155499 RepID=UPI0033F4647B
MRKSAGVLSALCAVLAMVVVAPSPAQAAERDPVIFVHGYKGGAWNWNDMIADFKADGWSGGRLFAMSYDITQSNKTTAAQLRSLVDSVRAQTGAAKVDVVAHSMGSLNSRWYLKFLGGTSYVDQWVSLGGPNHGTNLTPICSWLITSCAEMAPDSSFLRDLNAGDETPGGVRYQTFWSSCDEFINPDQSTILTGATNTNVGCIEHAWLLVSDPVSLKVRTFLKS